MFCDSVHYVTFTFWNSYVVCSYVCVTLRHMRFTLCCFTLCSNIGEGAGVRGQPAQHHPHLQPADGLHTGDRAGAQVSARHTLHPLCFSHGLHQGESDTNFQGRRVVDPLIFS
jgi:hypothetical protein